MEKFTIDPFYVAETIFGYLQENHPDICRDGQKHVVYGNIIDIPLQRKPHDLDLLRPIEEAVRKFEERNERYKGRLEAWAVGTDGRAIIKIK
jgi:hypothetical protein